MKVITLWQPWASLIFVDKPYRKLHETRHWPAPEWVIGKRIAIHAAKHLPNHAHVTDILKRLCGRAFEKPTHELPRGAIIGTVIIESCLLMDQNLVNSLTKAVCCR